jgi:hypothetical protein
MEWLKQFMHLNLSFVYFKYEISGPCASLYPHSSSTLWVYVYHVCFQRIRVSRCPNLVVQIPL